ncbi:MAG: hypothetical protein U0894_10410 [Pirellulales bacterium]
MTKVFSAEEVKLTNAFEQVRQQLLQPEMADRLDRPLAYWALPADRRLPLAFLGRTVGELLNTSFSHLASTAGVGHKKMESLVMLLNRAIHQQPQVRSESVAEGSDNARVQAEQNVESGEFNPDYVSELTWSKWRDTVRIHQIGGEKLGRLAPSLQALPTVIWDTPLSFYLDMTISQMRQLKTHGEKRVQAVLAVFHSIHQMLGHAGPNSGLVVRLAPRLIADVEDWMQDARLRKAPPEMPELVERLIEPLLEQLRVDVGDTVFTLARGRLGVGAKQESVRDQARSLALTRARVYQLLEECHRTMSVRWPEGRRLLDEFAQRLDELYASADGANLLGSMRELLYPLKFDSVSEHLLAEQTAGQE